jgi:hypothetical protein
MKRAAVVLALSALLGASSLVAAHEGHVHKVMGTVTAVSASQIEVDTKDAKKQAYALTKETVYRKGKAPASASDVKVGARVVLSVVEEHGAKSVTEVLMAEAQTGQ